MKVTDLIKNGKVDVSKIRKKDGTIDDAAVVMLEKEKPILPILKANEGVEVSVKLNRDRMNTFPDRLPTVGLNPLPMDEHSHIGMYETKQNIYLTLAHAYNRAMERIESLEEEVKKLKGI